MAAASVLVDHLWHSMFRLVRQNRPWFYEITLITEVDDTIEFRIKHFDAELKGWEPQDECVRFVLVALGRREAVFRELGSENPPWMIYRIREDGTQESFFHRPGADTPEEPFCYRRVTHPEVPGRSGGDSSPADAATGILATD